MSKYIINHKTKVVHHSSYVCDACRIPNYESEIRQDCTDEEQILSLVEKTYHQCPYCFELSPSVITPKTNAM
ncbi:hypothetical protein ACTWQL_19275 [Pseudalkalibacillus sp. R45]|uniref:hypothetical protein n=1 Tax=Pseudalkalibacillus sp. R45 TaxID=3457433 RepID=UPI003FCC6E60